MLFPRSDTQIVPQILISKLFETLLDPFLDESQPLSLTATMGHKSKSKPTTSSKSCVNKTSSSKKRSSKKEKKEEQSAQHLDFHNSINSIQDILLLGEEDDDENDPTSGGHGSFLDGSCSKMGNSSSHLSRRRSLDRGGMAQHCVRPTPAKQQLHSSIHTETTCNSSGSFLIESTRDLMEEYDRIVIDEEDEDESGWAVSTRSIISNLDFERYEDIANEYD